MGYKRYNQDEFIVKAKAVYGDYYDYSNIQWVKATTKIEIICPIHGTFQQQPAVHITGRGCRKCGDERIRKAQAFTTDIFLDLVQDKLMFGYDYSRVQYRNMHEPVEIVCKDHGSFFMAPDLHLRGRGCKNCRSRSSNVENEWLDMLGVPKNNRCRNVQLNLNDGYGSGWILADGFSRETNTVYEFWGDYWHGNPKTFNSDAFNFQANKTFGELYEKTQKKRQRIFDAGFKLIEIWESDYLTLRKHQKSQT